MFESVIIHVAIVHPYVLISDTILCGVLQALGFPGKRILPWHLYRWVSILTYDMRGDCTVHFLCVGAINLNLNI